MRRNRAWTLVATVAVVLFFLVWDFTPRVASEGPQQDESRIPVVAANAGYRSPSERHKLRVSDKALAREIESKGGRLLGDYGTYQLYEADSATTHALSQSQQVEVRDEDNVIKLNARAFDTSRSEVQAQRRALRAFNGKRMHLVQFIGPVKPEWYEALVSTGVRVVTYIPNNAYLVYGNAGSLQRVQALAKNASVVQWEGDYQNGDKIDPQIAPPETAKDNARLKKTRATTRARLKGKLSRSQSKGQLFAVQLLKDKTENAGTLQLIDSIRLEPITNQWEVLDYVDIVVSLPTAAIYNQLAKRPDVVSIAPYQTPVKMDERQDLIISGQLTGNAPTPLDYLSYLASKGFTQAQFDASNFAVNISDSGVDNATQSPNHFALYTLGDPNQPSRIIYNRLEGTANAGSTLKGCDGHGTLNTHIIGGYVPSGGIFASFPHADASGFRYGLGVAPFVKIGSSVIFDPDKYTNPNLINLEAKAYQDGARISSNSWGEPNNGRYDVDAQSYDKIVRDAQPTGAAITAPGNQQMVVVFAAGNDGPGSLTVGSPGTAKNVITVGAAENVQPFGGPDQCGVSDTSADSANDIVSFSSRGPTIDGRRKPEIVAPGTHVSGGITQATLVNPPSGNGMVDACFTGNGVCGGTGATPGGLFFPAGQQWYVASSGTSHSTPAVAGAAALVRQYFINQGFAPPSPAMTKATLMNTARYMTGAGANDTLWSNNQGLGELNMNLFYDIFATGAIIHDQRAADTFTASGQQRVVTGNILDPAKPFRVTLAYTDAPGPTTGAAYVNNLDLEVTVGGNTYKGNVFSGALSALGGNADPQNNAESVFLPAGMSGSFVIRVKATNIAGDGVPNSGPATDQDYALVAYNAGEAPAPVIESDSAAIVAESCGPANNAIDPGETVTVNFALRNIGTASASNVTATLLPTGGVTAPGGSQSYGTLPSGSPAVARSFTFSNNRTCGETLTATLHLQDGSTALGTVTFTFTVGKAALSSVAATYSTGNIATPIPDNQTVEIPINVSDVGVVSDVNVRVRLNHTFDADLVLDLVHPDGTVVNLASQVGADGQNFGGGSNDCSGTFTVFDDAATASITAAEAPFVGTFRPETLLSVLNGKPLSGTWKLRVTDTEQRDLGTVGCVQLELSRFQYICCGVAGTPSILAAPPATLVAESFGPRNNAIDPLETVTINFPLRNVGTGSTTNLVATLLTGGGVTNPSSAQSYGALPPDGTPVARPFTFTAGGACGGIITATFQLQDGAANLGTVTFTFNTGTPGPTTTFGPFTNAAAIAIPDSGAATPYPSTITVAGVPTTGAVPKVTLTNINHTYADDIDVLLVGPTGQKFILMSDAGGSSDPVNVTYTFDDAAASSLANNSLSPSGTYKPTNYDSGDTFPAPAPAGPYLSPGPAGAETLASAFSGLDPNGVWSLYVVDDTEMDSGSISGGWSLSFNVTAPVSCQQPSLMISEFRLHGASGPADEFVEIYNPGDQPFTVNSADGTGYALVASDGSIRFVIPNGTSIPARGHYLGVNSSGYSLGSYAAGNNTSATGDASWTTDIPDNAGIALFNTTASFTAAHLVDAAGFTATALYFEGSPISAVPSINGEYSFVRKVVATAGAANTGRSQDTSNNANDFVFVSTTGGSFGSAVASVLGAPGPENLLSPIQRNAQMTATLVDPAVGVANSPNRARNNTPIPGFPLGTFTIRRRYTNRTGQPVTRLRFRIVDITTLNSPGYVACPDPNNCGQADLRALSSSAVTVRRIDGSTVRVQGTRVEEPPTQSQGGGLNSSMAVDLNLELGGSIAPGASVNVQFHFGLAIRGNFSFLVNVETLP